MGMYLEGIWVKLESRVKCQGRQVKKVILTFVKVNDHLSQRHVSQPVFFIVAGQFNT